MSMNHFKRILRYLPFLAGLVLICGGMYLVITGNEVGIVHAFAGALVAGWELAGFTQEETK